MLHGFSFFLVTLRMSDQTFSNCEASFPFNRASLCLRLGWCSFSYSSSAVVQTGDQLLCKTKLKHSMKYKILV